MTIDLNERLRRVADEATAGLHLDHPGGLPEGSAPTDIVGVGVRRRRRAVSWALAIAAAAAVFVGLLVVVNRRAEVRTAPGGRTVPASLVPSERVAAALEQFRTTGWTAEATLADATMHLAHALPDRYMIRVEPINGGVDVVRQISIGDVMYDQSTSTDSGGAHLWTRLRVEQGLPYTERLFANLESISCWDERSPDVLYAPSTCAAAPGPIAAGGPPTTTFDESDQRPTDASVEVTLAKGRIVALNIISNISFADPTSEGPTTLRFHYGDVPSITAPDSSLVNDATTPLPELPSSDGPTATSAPTGATAPPTTGPGR